VGELTFAPNGKLNLCRAKFKRGAIQADYREPIAADLAALEYSSRSIGGTVGAHEDRYCRGARVTTYPQRIRAARIIPDVRRSGTIQDLGILSICRFTSPTCCLGMARGYGDA
jgi:hypothetical protein